MSDDPIVTHRGRLLTVTNQMLSSADAEDVVQIFLPVGV